MPALVQPGSTNALIRKEESENVELLQVRKETLEEYQLTRPDGTREAVTITFAFLLFFISLLVPASLMGWLVLLACGSLLVMTLLISWSPLSMPIKLITGVYKSTESLQVGNVDTLAAQALHVRDTLKVNGTGMCSVPDNYQSKGSYAYMPFDCSAVYWNNAAAAV
nr:Intracellular growth attenuator protein igaA [Candidatus Pantoea persica]